MTYLRFHLWFNLPLVVGLFLLTWKEPWSREELEALGSVLVAVMVFTIPWDNLAAKWGIWGFPTDKYWRKIGYLPVEEYAFFLLQSLNVILACRALLHDYPVWLLGVDVVMNEWTYLCLGASAFVWMILLGQLWFCRQWFSPRFNYALHLAWFLPVIYFQWVIALPLFWAHLGLLALLTFGFGSYYTVADLVAVKAGTWTFDEAQITGWKFRQVLPWEEIAFFYLTSLLVAQSYLLLVPSDLR